MSLGNPWGRAVQQQCQQPSPSPDPDREDQDRSPVRDNHLDWPACQAGAKKPGPGPRLFQVQDQEAQDRTGPGSRTEGPPQDHANEDKKDRDQGRNRVHKLNHGTSRIPGMSHVPPANKETSTGP